MLLYLNSFIGNSQVIFGGNCQCIHLICSSILSAVSLSHKLPLHLKLSHYLQDIRKYFQTTAANSHNTRKQSSIATSKDKDDGKVKKGKKKEKSPKKSDKRKRVAYISEVWFHMIISIYPISIKYSIKLKGLPLTLLTNNVISDFIRITSWEDW